MDGGQNKVAVLRQQEHCFSVSQL